MNRISKTERLDSKKIFTGKQMVDTIFVNVKSTKWIYQTQISMKIAFAKLLILINRKKFEKLHDGFTNIFSVFFFWDVFESVTTFKLPIFISSRTQVVHILLTNRRTQSPNESSFWTLDLIICENFADHLIWIFFIQLQNIESNWQYSYNIYWF